MLKEILNNLPPAEKTQLMAAFNGGFSHRVESGDYWIGVYQPQTNNTIEELGAWSLWRK